MSILPVGVWGLHVPAEAGPVPAASEDFDETSNALFRITMAALDPTAKPLDKDAPNRATLKILRRKFNPDDMLGSDSEDEDEDNEDEEDQDSEDEEVEVVKNGKKAQLSKKEKKEAIKKTMAALAAEEKMDVDSDRKDDDEDDSDEEEEDGSYEVEEFVLCTLDPEKHYQQPLDVTVGEDEEVMFQVVGNYDIYLTGNLVIHQNPHDFDDDEDSEDEEDYDLSPSEEELLYGNGADSDESEDELDDIADPRIQEIDTDEEKPEAKKLTKAEKKELKRTADELEAESTPEKKLSKKQLKKLKANDGKPIEKAANETPDNKKKVQFAKELEQGPSSAEKKSEKKDKKEKKEKKEEKKASQIRVVDGVTIEEKAVGKGPAAKSGNRIEMRYIGKLPNGKQFDSNTKGKPFAFKLGAGDVIKGWDIGVKGMQIGSERRLTIPPALGYGKKSLPGIPANSTLVFEVKLLSIK